MKMKNIILVYISTLFFVTGNIAISLGQDSETIAGLTEQIKNVDKVDKLYNLRYRLEKMGANQNLSMKDKAKVKEGFRILSNRFASFNHFLNATEVYKEYLNYNEAFLNGYNKYYIDSVKTSHTQLTNSEIQKIAELDQETESLKKSSAEVAGLKQKYYTIGGMAALGIVLLFFLIFSNRNRSIRNTYQQLAENRKQMSDLHKSFTEAKTLSGAITYSRHVAEQTSTLIDSLLESEQSSFSKEDIATLQKVKAAFQKIS